MFYPSQAVLRKAASKDIDPIRRLYLAVAHQGRGILRIPSEITTSYVSGFVQAALQNGIIYVLETSEGELAGEIHAYVPKLHAFRHLLAELTVVVHPKHQGRGYGRQLFTKLLEEVELTRPDLLRVELFVRQKNHRAVKFYTSLGFQGDGVLRNRVLNEDQSLEGPVCMSWMNPNYLPGAVSLPTKNARIMVRPVQAADIPKLSVTASAIYLQHFQDLWIDGSVWYRKYAFAEDRLLEELQRKEVSWYLVQHLSGRAVGFIKIIDRHGADFFPDADSMQLERIYLDRASTGQGIGEALIRQIDKWAVRAGRSHVWLKVMAYRKESIRFYEKMGFEVTGKTQLDLPGVKDIYRDMLVMYKKRSLVAFAALDS